jgi:hypothetical protein
MPKRRKHRTPANNGSVQQVSAPRNPFADHPLMRKGGVHEKSKKTLRASIRRETKQLVRDYIVFLFR